MQNFCGQATPTKIKPANIFTHDELATVITMAYSHPLKKLSPGVFNPRNIVITRISTFTILYVCTVLKNTEELQLYAALHTVLLVGDCNATLCSGLNWAALLQYRSRC